MAGVKWAAVTGEVVTGTSLKTILQVKAAAGTRIVVKEWSISFIGTSNTAQPIKVDVMRQTTAGTMTSLTPVKVNSSDDETLTTTAQHTATVEPTASDIIFSEEVHPQSGYTWQAPFGEEIIVPNAGRLAIVVTAAASTSCVARFKGEE